MQLCKSPQFHHVLFLLLLFPLCLLALANQNPAFELLRTKVIEIQDTLYEAILRASHAFYNLPQ